MVPQRLQRHHADHEQVAQTLHLLASRGLVGVGDRGQELIQLIVAQIIEILGGLAHARRLHPGGGLSARRPALARGLVEAPHDGELPADGDGLVVSFEQRGTVAA